MPDVTSVAGKPLSLRSVHYTSRINKCRRLCDIKSYRPDHLKMAGQPSETAVYVYCGEGAGHRSLMSAMESLRNALDIKVECHHSLCKTTTQNFKDKAGMHLFLLG